MSLQRSLVSAGEDNRTLIVYTYVVHEFMETGATLGTTR